MSVSEQSTSEPELLDLGELPSHGDSVEAERAHRKKQLAIA